jgi:hypothetical protein
MSGGDNDVRFWSVAVDPLGDVVVAGGFLASILSLGGTNNLARIGAGADGLLFKLRSTGTTAWAHSVFGSGGRDQQLTLVQLDTAGNIVVRG